MNYKLLISFERIFFLFAFLGFLPLVSHAQNPEFVKSNPDFYYGEGYGTTLEEANQNAFGSLTESITVSVSVNTTTTTTEQQDQINEDYKRETDIKSSLEGLTNTKQIIISSGPNFHVLRYIERSEIDKIYESRKIKILDFVNSAQRAVLKYRIGDGLRNYYWALKLIYSLPSSYQSSLKGESERLMSTEIQELITEILDSISVVPINKRNLDTGYTEVGLNFLYNNSPMVNCDFAYFDSYDWINSSVKDGFGTCEVPQNTNSIKLRIEYEFKKLWKSDSEVNAVLSQNNVTTPFAAREKNIILQTQDIKNNNTEITAKELMKNVQIDSLGLSNKKDIKSLSYVVDTVIQSINSKNYNNSKNCFTENGWKWFEKLVKYGNAKIISRPELQITAFNNGYLCRGIKAKFNFKKNNKQFVEDLVFYFNHEGKIESLNFGLEQSAIQDIAKHSTWNDTSRVVLINFLENYKTAYALERIDYLDAIFSNDALIIVGTKISNRNRLEFDSGFESYRYNTVSKSDYIKNLREVFNSQEYVNIQFEDASVKRTGRYGERYEIIIKQNYYSMNYADKGYLYLLVDLENPSQPIVYVRVWDEYKNKLMSYGEWNF